MVVHASRAGPCGTWAGRGPRPGAGHTPDPLTGEDWQAWCDSQVDQDEPPDPDEEEPDPDGLPGPWEYDLDAIVADCRAGHRGGGRGVRPCGPDGAGRRAAGRPGPARPGAAGLGPAGLRGSTCPGAAGFAAGMLLDTMPGCNALAGFASPRPPGMTTPTTAPATMRSPG